MTMGALHRRLVDVIVVAVVVAVCVLVFERVMQVKVLMLLGEVEVHGEPEERSRARNERGPAAIAEGESERGAHEGPDGKERPGARGADRALRAQIQLQAKPVAGRAARE